MATGTGLTGEYFKSSTFVDPLLTRIDSKVDFDWAKGSPAPNIVPSDNFYVRWSGQIEAPSSDAYTFYTYSDDGVRLWVNDQLIINNWTDHAATQNQGSLTLAAGQKYNIRMEYYEKGGGAIAQLSWSSPGQTQQIIPTSQLYAASTPAPPTPGILTFESATYTVNEGGTSALVKIARTGGSNGAISAQVVRTGGTATPGQDFDNQLPVTISFAAGETGIKTFSIPILEDTAVDPNETINLALSGLAGGATLGSQNTATVQIIDNDAGGGGGGTTLPGAPRLFLDAARLSATRAAVKKPGSHHQVAFDVIKARVEKNDWRVYDENPSDGNWNYARAWLAREASFVYQVTGVQSYAQIAFDALYAIHNDPDPEGRLPDSGSHGLARAATGMGFALAYDWAASGWNQSQKDYVRGKIITSLNKWPSYSHANLTSPYGSNWVAVCRGAELVMTLAVGEEQNRATRFGNLKSWLSGHINKAYGNAGFTQEGQGYLSYAGGFLMPAVYALRSIGDRSLEGALSTVKFEQLPLYAGVFDAQQASLEFGVAGMGFDAEGLTSFLLDNTDPARRPYYQYFYDRHRGLANPAANENKFDHRRAGSVWSVLYYPTESAGVDPTGVLPAAIQDSEKGGYLFRNRWQDANDVLVGLMGDFDRHPRSWDQPEAFALGLHAYNTHYFGGPAKELAAKYFSKLLVDGKVGNPTATGAPDFFEARSAGGYAIVDGGNMYRGLGVDQSKRHLLVDFSGNVGSALLSTMDRLSDVENHIYTWQANLGTYADNGGITAIAGQEGSLKTFLLKGNQNSYLKGWILNPSNVTVRAGDPLQLETTGSTTNIWVVMVVGTGAPPTASVNGSGLNSELQLGNALVYFDAASNRIVTKQVVNPLLTVTGTVNNDSLSRNAGGNNDSLSGNAGANQIAGLDGQDVLTGGSGFDQFIYFKPTDGSDTLTDFSVDDAVLISATGFGSGLVAGTSLADGSAASGGQFVLGTTAVNGLPTFLYAQGQLNFDPDGVGSQSATTLATLTGSPTLTAEQIQLF
jgi:Ca2+-binding RTX toxin-like protein